MDKVIQALSTLCDNHWWQWPPQLLGQEAVECIQVVPLQNVKHRWHGRLERVVIAHYFLSEEGMLREVELDGILAREPLLVLGKGDGPLATDLDAFIYPQPASPPFEDPATHLWRTHC
jgi:hypothetical protein